MKYCHVKGGLNDSYVSSQRLRGRRDIQLQHGGYAVMRSLLESRHDSRLNPYPSAQTIPCVALLQKLKVIQSMMLMAKIDSAFSETCE